MKKKIYLSNLLEYLNIKKKSKFKDFRVKNISSLNQAKNGDITICSNSNYLEFLAKTQASACLVKEKFLKYVPSHCYPIISNIPDYDLLKISNIINPENIIDNITNNNFSNVELKKKFKKIFFGKNFFCEKKVKIGNNVSIGYNVVIKNNSIIGNNVNIGSNVLISNSIIENNVNICDGTVIGKKGFGFKFIDNKLYRVPHIGKVIIKANAEIGSNCSIDRGSIDDTIIGEFSFIDNQVHIAHNVKIGNYCIVAAQTGISGSTIIGNNVIIGGQVGISGHLKIGNNVKIGGKSGVVKNIQDNKTVMGYPALDFREFIKKNLKK